MNAPESIVEKMPSAGLYEGQTDEKEIGMSYNEIDNYILFGEGEDGIKQKIAKLHNITEHKRKMPSVFR